jgi:gamma-butyrobetaine dioxygenase
MSDVASTTAPGPVELSDDLVCLRLPGGSRLELHRLVLRDGCGCSECRHPVSGQRLFDTAVVVPAARIARAEIENGTLELVWEDGHRSSFDESWLVTQSQAAGGGSRRARPIACWGSELADALPTTTYRDVVADRGELRRFLAAVSELGFAVLVGAPATDGAVAGIAELFGHVRETNYGRVFDVATKVDATNLADTSLPLGLHTDNPYRDPVPTMQLLQCLVSSAAGGHTILADGFRAVSLLGKQSPARVEILSRTPIRFAYRDQVAELEAEASILELDERGRPRAIRLNNRSKGTPVGPPGDVLAWYEAYFELVALLDRPEAQVVFRLDPGDVVVFDNRRVLHARTGFSGEGERRLQGCYADRDGLLSTLAVLERELA